MLTTNLGDVRDDAHEVAIAQLLDQQLDIHDLIGKQANHQRSIGMFKRVELKNHSENEGGQFLTW